MLIDDLFVALNYLLTNNPLQYKIGAYLLQARKSFSCSASESRGITLGLGAGLANAMAECLSFSQWVTLGLGARFADTVAECFSITLGLGAWLANTVAEWFRGGHRSGECVGNGLSSTLDLGARLTNTVAEGLCITSELGTWLSNTVAESFGIYDKELATDFVYLNRVGGILLTSFRSSFRCCESGSEAQLLVVFNWVWLSFGNGSCKSICGTLGLGAGLTNAVAEGFGIGHGISICFWLSESLSNSFSSTLDLGAWLADTMAESLGVSTAFDFGVWLADTVAEWVCVRDSSSVDGGGQDDDTDGRGELHFDWLK